MAAASVRGHRGAPRSQSRCSSSMTARPARLRTSSLRCARKRANAVRCSKTLPAFLSLRGTLCSSGSASVTGLNSSVAVLKQKWPDDKNNKARKSGPVVNLAGVQGFEPRNAGIRIRCLTAWRHPNSVFSNCLVWLGYEDSNLGMPESESGALPLGDTPIIWWLRRDLNL